MNIRSGPFEGPVNFKPPALPEVDDFNTAFIMQGASVGWSGLLGR
jgi:hypothetical protein